MATRYYGVNVGGDMPTDVSEAGSTTSRPVELVLTYDATGMNKMQALKALEAIQNYISQDTWPPV